MLNPNLEIEVREAERQARRSQSGPMMNPNLEIEVREAERQARRSQSGPVPHQQQRQGNTMNVQTTQSISPDAIIAGGTIYKAEEPTSYHPYDDDFFVPTGLVRINPGPPATNNQHLISNIGSRDGVTATYSQVAEIPVPEERIRESTGNSSFVPVPFVTLIDMVRDRWSAELGREPTCETFALSGKGQRMVGRIIWEDPDLPDGGVAALLRGSYDSSMAPQVAGPTLYQFACTNGCFPASTFEIDGRTVSSVWKTKQTTDVRGRLYRMIDSHCSTVIPQVQSLKDMRNRWRNVAMGHDLFYAMCGVMVGRGIITPTQMNVAMRYFRDIYDARENRGKARAAWGDNWERFANQADGSVLAGFEALSAALKRSAPQRTFERHARVSNAVDFVAASGGASEGIPAFVMPITEF